MSSKFFTNQNENSLENRLKDILTHYQIKSIEFLIGYFRISGFNRISTLLDGVEKARILVGIDVDKLTLESLSRGKNINLFNQKRFISEFKKNQEDILQKEDYSSEIDKSVQQFIKMVSENRLEIRISQQKNVHSKIYILRENEFKRHDGSIEYKGSVITGSSNLTASGLSNNYEFNVELRDQRDIEFALNEFENLWLTSVEISKEDVSNIKENTYLKEITPYELYIKFLIEHFEQRVEYDPSIADDLPKGYMKLAYQIDAVNEGLAKLEKHNGFFLSDVVGLGKTVTTAMIIKQLSLKPKRGRVLIIAPPSIENEWKETFDRFQIWHYVFKSFGSLEKLKNTENFEIIIIDESHKFKNYATSRYKELERICKEQIKYQKKVILISATPLNNRPEDIANQLYLFQDKRNSTIPSHPNLESFFAPINKTYREIIKIKKDKVVLSPEDLEKLEKLAQSIRDDILREVMVRKTRTDIQENKIYANDIQKQGLHIPKINPIKELEYKLDDNLLFIFDETIDILVNKLKYHRYKILANLNIQGQKKYGSVQKGFFEKSSLNLAEIMMTTLIKRLESSFVAFKSSIQKQEKNLKILIDMFEKGEIFIPSKSFNIYDLIEKDEESFLENLEYFMSEEKVRAFAKDDFNDEYLDNLKQDLEIFKTLVKMWENIDYDPKLEEFKGIIRGHTEKIIVFTESKQTALYLEQKLTRFKKVLTVHGENREKLKTTIRENFDANYEDKKNDFNVLISTDTLSEGVNMHRSNIVYNYDIPWNSTRLMQRIGRINRIGTKHSEINIYNFKPTAKSEKLIELSKKAYVKLQTFHSTVGEDSQIYTKDEKVSTVNLFESGEEKADEELKFLEEIRAYKEAYPTTFKKIENLPKKIRVQRKQVKYSKTSLVFIKSEKAKNYYKIDDKECKPINFIEMAKCLKAKKDEQGILPYRNFHYLHVNKALGFYKKELVSVSQNKEKIKVDHKNDRSALKILRSWRDKHLIDISIFTIFTKAIENGKLQNLSKEIVTFSKKANHSEVLDKLEILQKKYSLFEEEKQVQVQKQTDIILSETFI